MFRRLQVILGMLVAKPVPVAITLNQDSGSCVHVLSERTYPNLIALCVNRAGYKSGRNAMRIAAIVKSMAFLLTGSVAMLAAPVAHAGVSATFYETACYEQTPSGPMCPTSSPGSFFNSGPLPAALGHFSSPDNSGSYSFSQSAQFPTPVVNGDTNFSFNWGANDAPPSHLPCFNSAFVEVCRWDIGWTTSSISIDFEGDINSNINIGNLGGMIGSDGPMPGCGEFAECAITGYWTFSVPEPSSLAGLATAGFGIFLVIAARARRRADIGAT
jgi:PEP-CTERM motif